MRLGLSGLAMMAMLAQAVAMHEDEAAHGGHLTEGVAAKSSKSDCVKWVEFKLPCSGSEWWASTMDRHFDFIRIIPQLIAGHDTKQGMTTQSAAKKMEEALDGNHREITPANYVRESNGNCAYGWATNPLCVPAGSWKLAAPKIKKADGKLVLWQRTNLAKWAASIMIKGNASSGCNEHNINPNDKKSIKACSEAHLYFQPALYLNIITMVACQQNLQERIMTMALPHMTPIRAVYETMQLNATAEPLRVLKEMGIDNPVVSKNLEDAKAKKGSDSLKDKVDNYKAVAKFLKGVDAEHPDVLGTSDCSLHEMFTSTQPKQWSCDTQKVCSSLHNAQPDLDWAIDSPPQFGWTYVTSAVDYERCKAGYGKPRACAHKKGWNQTSGYEVTYGAYGTYKDFFTEGELEPQ